MVKVKILYFVIILEVLVLNIMYKRNWPLWLMIITIAIPILLKIGQLVTASGLEISTVCDEDIINKNSKAHVSFLVKTKKTLIVNKICIKYRYKFSYEETYHKGAAEISLYGKCENKIDIEPLCEHIGTLSIEIKKIVLYDMMYLLHKVYKKKLDDVKVYIMPKHIENIGIPNLSVVNKFLDSDRFSDEKPGDDPSEIFDIREFKDGDRLNSIHWNLTVKTGKIMVKDFSFPLNNSDRIVFASQKKVFDNTDMMFEGLLSLIYLMLEQKRTVTICYPNNKIWDEVTIEGYEDVVSALKTILECDVTTSEIDEVNISDTLSSTNGNCYLITDNVSEKNNFKDMFGILTINSIIESRRIIKLKDWMIYE